MSVQAGVEIRGRPVVQDRQCLGKDDHVLIDGSPSDNLIFALINVLYYVLGGTTKFFKDGSP
jgi:hypothetical protein